MERTGDGVAQRRRRRERAAHLAQVVVCDDRMLGQGQGDRRHHVHDRHAVLLYQLQVLLEIEAWHRHHRRALNKAEIEKRDDAVDVEERQKRQYGVLRGHQRGIRDAPDRAQLRDEVVMGDHHPLGNPGRTARVRQRDEILARVDLDNRRPGFVRQQGSKGRRPFGFAEDEDFLHFRFYGRFFRRGEERCDGQEKACPGIRKLLGEFARRVQRIDGGHDAAKRRGSMKGHGVLRDVRAVDREAVALAETARGKSRRGTRHQARQLAVGDGAPACAIDERRLVAAPLGVLQNVFTE